MEDDEQDRPRRDAVDHPFGVEAERVVDELERHLRHCRRIVAPRRRAQFGRLAVRQQHVAAVGKLGVAGERALDTVRDGTLQQIMVLVRAAHAAHPACPRDRCREATAIVTGGIGFRPFEVVREEKGA